MSFMGSAKKAIQYEVQHATNTTTLAQPNPAPPSPPPMVLQNPLPVQGLVATAPAHQPNPTTLAAPPLAEIDVHHMLALTKPL